MHRVKHAPSPLTDKPHLSTGNSHMWSGTPYTPTGVTTQTQHVQSDTQTPKDTKHTDTVFPNTPFLKLHVTRNSRYYQWTQPTLRLGTTPHTTPGTPSEAVYYTATQTQHSLSAGTWTVFLAGEGEAPQHGHSPQHAAQGHITECDTRLYMHNAHTETQHTLMCRRKSAGKHLAQ